MWIRVSRWFDHVPIVDPLERRQALLLQWFEVLITITSLLMLPLIFLAPLALAGKLAIGGLTLMVCVGSLYTLMIVRRGHVRRSATLLAVILTLILCAMLYANGLSQGALSIFGLAIPLALAGLIAGRSGLLAVAGLSIGGVATAILLERAAAPGAAIIGRLYADSGPALVTPLIFALLVGLLAVMIDSIHHQMTHALALRRTRERELEALTRQLETAVQERTADLEMALVDLERRAARQADLIAENDRQQQMIGELSVPVLPLGDRLIVIPIVGNLDGDRLAVLQARVLAAVGRYRARRVLLDISGVPLVDTLVAQGLIQTLQAARLLGAEVWLIGVRPEVAQAVVGLGLDLHMLQSYADLEVALQAVRTHDRGPDGVPRTAALPPATDQGHTSSLAPFLHHEE